MRKGSKHTPEARALMSERSTRRKTEEEKRKISIAHTGVPRTQDAKDKIRQGKLLYKLTDSHRQHMLDAAKKKVERTCRVCGTVYQGRHSSFYCSKECKEMNKPKYPIPKRFDPIPAMDSVCKKTGAGHRWIEVYTNSYVQIIKCIDCMRDSVGYFPRLQIQKLLDEATEEFDDHSQ